MVGEWVRWHKFTNLTKRPPSYGFYHTGTLFGVGVDKENTKEGVIWRAVVCGYNNLLSKPLAVIGKYASKKKAMKRVDEYVRNNPRGGTVRTPYQWKGRKGNRIKKMTHKFFI